MKTLKWFNSFLQKELYEKDQDERIQLVVEYCLVIRVKGISKLHLV